MTRLLSRTRDFRVIPHTKNQHPCLYHLSHCRAIGLGRGSETTGTTFNILQDRPNYHAPGGMEAAEPEIRTLFGFSGNNCEHFTRPHGSSHSSAPQIMSCVNSIAGQIPDHSVTQPQRSCATFAVPTQPHCDCHERCCPPRSGHIDRRGNGVVQRSTLYEVVHPRRWRQEFRRSPNPCVLALWLCGVDLPCQPN